MGTHVEKSSRQILLKLLGVEEVNWKSMIRFLDIKGTFLFRVKNSNRVLLFENLLRK